GTRDEGSCACSWPASDARNRPIETANGGTNSPVVRNVMSGILPRRDGSPPATAGGTISGRPTTSGWLAVQEPWTFRSPPPGEAIPAGGCCRSGSTAHRRGHRLRPAAPRRYRDKHGG